MESEEDKRGSSDNEEGISGSESVEGSDADAAEAELEVAAVRHNCNPRSKRGVPVDIEEPMHVKKNKIAPGVGVVADRYHVGGRDQRVSCRPCGMSAGSESSDVERSDTDRGRKGSGSGESGCSPSVETFSESSDGQSRHRYERQGTTLGCRRLASSLTTRMSREELEAQSARLRAHLRKGVPKRLNMLSPLTNELVIRQDSSRPSDAGRKEKNRREPSASDLLGQVPVKPGRALFSDSASDPDNKSNCML